MIDRLYPFGAEIHWGPDHDTETAWNLVTALNIEKFGLPGDRYIVDINIDSMTWWFKDTNDRTLFLLINGRARCTQLELPELQ